MLARYSRKKGHRVVVNDATATIDVIVKELAEKKIGAIVIVDEAGKVAGIVFRTRCHAIPGPEWGKHAWAICSHDHDARCRDMQGA